MNNDFRMTPLIVRSLDATLNQIESAQLVRRLTDLDAAYLFKHARVQDGAYLSLTRHERKRLHHFVAQTLERENADVLDETAALLAYHFEQAGEWAPALTYLQRAAEWAARAALDDVSAALERARGLGDPLLLFQVRITHLALAHDDARAAEARALARHILAALPDEELRARFQAVIVEWI
jgi:predicted ATPase